MKRRRQCFREAIAIKPNFSDPHANLGVLLRQKSYLVDSEASLRRALKLRPNDLDARINLGLTLVFLGRLRDARACFAKVLKSAPRNVLALFGMGQIATVEGRFEEAETTYRRIIEIDPKMTNAWAALALTRKMTNADGEWLKGAEEIATSAIHPMEEANLRFAMGKYCDDVNDFAQAFQNFKRGNELLKTAAEDYDRKERSHFIDELIRVYSRESISKIGAAGSPSAKPVFVVGMPRSGTSLAEQIIASHPAAYGAGELDFWAALIAKDTGLNAGYFSEPTRPKVAEEYLRILERLLRECVARRRQGACELRFSGTDLLGVPERSRHLHAARPDRHLPFLLFPAVLDRASTSRSICRTSSTTTANTSGSWRIGARYCRLDLFLTCLTKNWLPIKRPGRAKCWISSVWNGTHGCLEFHTNQRQVTTASAWQVRQKIYKSSVARWRNYEKFIGPLKALGK